MISFDAIINSLKETIILFDKKTKITYINKSGEELFRKSSKDITGKTLLQIVNSEKTISNGEKTISSLIKKTINEGRSLRGRSVSLNIGHPINIDFSLSPFFINDRIDGAILSISENINISDREDYDYDFDSAVYLLGTIAHEIKNPLAGIKGAAQLLRNDTQSAGITEYTNLIIRETDRLNSILQDYLTICKNPSFHPVNIHEVMEKALAIMNIQIVKAGITIRRMYDPSLPQIEGDEAKLLQVFLNIIKNAVESMEKGGRLEITTSPSKESFLDHGKIKRWVLISVKDSGKGIPEKDIKKIFLPFYTKKKSGTGIGLALSKKVIKDHGGFIKVKSQINKGTVFYLYMPFGHNG
ncbi:MAG: PAS domain-containing protein [Nitrospiraceae bacterium]|jgi:two-component system, NtrC family, nitrogen regulation sensor histidine kinase GlnL|nr:MAG: PAS domain-containing protein [Nitrospiraceae bacterium]